MTLIITLMLIAGLVCFLIAFFAGQWRGRDMGWLGLAFWIGTILIERLS